MMSVAGYKHTTRAVAACNPNYRPAPLAANGRGVGTMSHGPGGFIARKSLGGDVVPC